MSESNEKTVAGVFEDYTAAERAARNLNEAGIARESIRVNSNFMTGAAGRTSYAGEPEEGGITGFFRRMFGGEDTEAGHYSEAVRRGNSIVTVATTRDQIEKVVEILNSAGAVDIERHVERYRQTGYEQYDPNAQPYSHDEAVKEREQFRSKETGKSIPVVEEQLEVGKRVIRRGGVRVYSRVVEQPVTENVELREEHVRVDRRPVKGDRPANVGPDQFREQSIEVDEMVEVPVVQKRARVREEVVVGKETSKRTEQVRDKVRSTEVEVERQGEAAGAREVAGEDYADDFRSDWQGRYANSGEPYDAYAPAYEYGYRAAAEPRYNGKSWSDVEEDLRTDYLRNNPNSAWDRMKGAVRYGWERVTGKR